jgi:hypothetical protein
VAQTGPSGPTGHVGQERSRPEELTGIARRHLCFGWWSLLLFLVLGVVIFGGDAGPGIYLVPFGAVLLFVAVYLAARGTRHAWPKERRPSEPS